MRINVNSLDSRGSFVDGPGIRTLLFLQGCDRHCEDCHNKSTWPMDKGISYEIPELVRVLKEVCHNRKITITGGEPLCQKEALSELLKELDDFDICLYTSYSLEDVPDEILSRLKYIKVGLYDRKLRCTTIPYIGSTNQKFITLR